jgi:hypothetical protein
MRNTPAPEAACGFRRPVGPHPVHPQIAALTLGRRILVYLRGCDRLRLKKQMRRLLLPALVVLLSVGQLQAASAKPRDILIGDQSTDAIIRVDPLTGKQAIMSSGGFVQNPFGLAIDWTGQLIVSDMPGGPA